MYIQLVSVHGLVRGESVEMGRDADTGGQVRYVLELARTLSKFPEVEQVDLLTRRIRDKRVSSDYSEEIESLGPKCRIVRIACGGGRYIRKEKLWPHLDEFVEGAIAFTAREGRTPRIVHGHYADGGYIARHLAENFAVPFVFTGHSLGKPKLEYLMSEGWTHEKANEVLTIDRRIAEEQDCLNEAKLLIASTRHEMLTQYAEYEKPEGLRQEIIPPGTDLERFFPHYDYELPGETIDERFKQARFRMSESLSRFFTHPDKPLILSVCRPDRRKNIQALIKAYGESQRLQAIANLAVFAGIRSDIESMPENEQQVLTDILLLMDRHDLYGRLAIPKRHDSEYEVPELYRLAAASRGVFVNSAFIELFGLTAIEAAATGLPFVATEKGGPTDIAANTHAGLTVDVTDQEALTAAMLDVLSDPQRWDEMSSSGINKVREHYSWDAHCAKYMRAIHEIAGDAPPSEAGSAHPRRRLEQVECMLITDIDGTLLGDHEALSALKDVLHEERGRIALGVASGRSPELVDEALQEAGIPKVDLAIAAVGSEICYGRRFIPDRGWIARLQKNWRPEALGSAMDSIDWIELQPEPHTQRMFKLSYRITREVSPEEAEQQIREALDATGATYTLIISHADLVDVLPKAASKGKAIRYLADKWNWKPEQIYTAGDSGNDRDMLSGIGRGIIVGNHTVELKGLKKPRGGELFYARSEYAAGILEGLRHFGFLRDSAAASESTGEAAEQAAGASKSEAIAESS
ncbi:HAD-IIB family hydrolase [Candidatus Laterigemmans baculatus]|uniref:HAD-IIB family hydrolase n=1 Tax=Candidatus Laterigemmans baculatus TaxID=2770505 RepID=UPI0013DA126F|nr:HAD-IIB family hydrolase [Candidatus Laterigemmans baculatus]